MNILFENKTQYTKKLYSTFLDFHTKKYGFYYILYTFCILIALIFCTIIQLNNHNYSLIFLFLIIFTIFILWRILHPIQLINKEFNSPKISNEKSFTFDFYDSYFKVFDNTDFYEMKYYKLHKVFETSDYFYLYFDKTYSFILDKNSFVLGTVDDFSKFLHKKCWIIYKKVL